MKEVQTRTLTLTPPTSSFARKDFNVFEARPPGDVRGGILLVQEIFGVNHHIESLAQRYASHGYLVWAPSYFDHIEPGVALGYDMGSRPKAMELMKKIGFDQPLIDTRTSAEAMRAALPPEARRIAVVGFCWGGSMAWLSACRIGRPLIDVAVGYYGRFALDYADEAPRVPVMMQFGKKDSSIPMDRVEQFRRQQPDVPVYIYDAGHGFSCDERADYNRAAAELAQKRTFEFIETNWRRERAYDTEAHP